MIDPTTLCSFLYNENVRYFTGVPDSLMEGFCSALSQNIPDTYHYISTSEGAAVAQAAGYYLVSGNTPCVYMQNSGFPNAMNPLLSLAAPEVGGIPMLLLVGWRGDPDASDEPQHIRLGGAMNTLLESIKLPYIILHDDIETASQQLHALIAHARQHSSPVVALVRKKVFDMGRKPSPIHQPLPINDAMDVIIRNAPPNTTLVASTGFTSRALAARIALSERKDICPLYVVGAMGHALSVSVGMARGKPHQLFYCISGDGSTLMHLGALAEAAACQNLSVFLMNNLVHASVGGQRTMADRIDWLALACSFGYNESARADHIDTLTSLTTQPSTASRMVEVRVSYEPEQTWPRPHLPPQDNHRHVEKFHQGGLP